MAVSISGHNYETLAYCQIDLSGDITLTNAFDEVYWGDASFNAISSYWEVPYDNKSGYNTGGYYEVQQAGNYLVSGCINIQGSGTFILEFIREDSSGNELYRFRATRSNTGNTNQAESGCFHFPECPIGERLRMISYCNASGNTVEGDQVDGGGTVRKSTFQITQLSINHIA